MSAATPARRAALEVLRRCFEHGAWADRALPAAAERHGLEGRELAQAQRLAYGSVQRRGTSDALIAELCDRRPERLDPPVVAALRLGLFELMFADATPDHAAVDAGVELAKGGLAGVGARRANAAAGLVNAILRRAARERAELLASLRDETPQGAARAHSVPLWLAELWWRELGADSARSLLAAVNEPPETALRANVLRVEPAQLATELERAGEPVRRASAKDLLWPAEALVVDGPLGAATRERLRSGSAIAQSRGAQAVVEALEPRPGERALDVCAAPGGKSIAIAGRLDAGGTLVAVERDPARAREMRELCERAGAAVDVRVADAAGTSLGAGYDRVLVDPPCSDLGTLASRPDARWRKTPRTVAELAALQARILDRAAAAVVPGGTLVYSTCTVSRVENEAVVSALLDRRPELAADHLGAQHPGLASTDDHRFLQTRPDRDGTDGFFIARVRREARA